MHSRLTRRESLNLLVTGLAATVGAQYSARTFADESPLKPPTKTSWPSFRNGPQQLGIAHTEFAAQPEQLWELKSRDGWVAASAIVGDHVYAPALEGFLYCLDRQTGRIIWKYRSIADTDEKKFAPGFKAAPTVTASTVYVGDEDGILHAVDRASGRKLWTFETGAEIAGGVALYKDDLLLASYDSTLYCLSKTGERKWSFLTEDMINCSPAVVDHFTFVSGCDAHIRVIDLRDGSEVRSVEMSSHLIASPAVDGDMLYVGTHAGDFCAVNWKTGKIVWQYRGEREMPYHASAAVTADTVLVGSHDKLMHAIDRKTGKARWTFATRARVESSAAVVDTRVFFGSGDGNLYGLNIADGKQVWKFNCGKPINCGMAIGEGCLVAGEDDHNGRLRCFGTPS